LQLALLAVAIVAAASLDNGAQLAAALFDIAGRNVVERQCCIVQMLAGERFLDMLLTLAEPVEGGVKLVLVDIAEFENLDKTRRRRGGVKHAGGSELGGGREQAHHDHRHNEIATAIAQRPENAVEADFTQGAERGGDMTIREGAAHDDWILADWARLPAFEKGTKPLDESGRPAGEIDECAFFDVAVLAIGFAQEDGDRNYPPALSARRSGARLLISALPLPRSAISESMSLWIVLICSA
jgi:hypothetical protein